MYFRLLIFAIMISCAQAMAQSAHSPDEGKKPEFDEITFGAESTKVKKKKAKHGYDKEFDKKIEEFDKRMKANAKASMKMEREMQKPQYSDPTYFGHKKKPKKRPPGKKKFCKVCGMKH